MISYLYLNIMILYGWKLTLEISIHLKNRYDYEYQFERIINAREGMIKTIHSRYTYILWYKVIPTVYRMIFLEWHWTYL